MNEVNEQLTVAILAVLLAAVVTSRPMIYKLANLVVEGPNLATRIWALVLLILSVLLDAAAFSVLTLLGLLAYILFGPPGVLAFLAAFPIAWLVKFLAEKLPS